MNLINTSQEIVPEYNSGSFLLYRLALYPIQTIRIFSVPLQSWAVQYAYEEAHRTAQD
jgi:hypothetical protein